MMSNQIYFPEPDPLPLVNNILVSMVVSGPGVVLRFPFPPEENILTLVFARRGSEWLLVQ